eukprot:8065558-Heterocapsa_arctica.AAC.1
MGAQLAASIYKATSALLQDHQPPLSRIGELTTMRATRATRDHLVWRIQLLTPIDDKAAFINTMRRIY